MRGGTAGSGEDLAPRAQAQARAFLAGYGAVPDGNRVRDLAVVAAARVAAVYAFRRPIGPGDVGTGALAEDVGGAGLGLRLVRAVASGVPGLPGDRAA